jgi:hypothetical protein
MALDKQHAYALYFLLVSESQMIQNLRAAQCNSSAAFVTALQNQVNSLEPGLTVDPSLGNLWSGTDPGTGDTLIDQDAASVLGALPSLAAPYSGGPCPRASEQPAAWTALKTVPTP